MIKSEKNIDECFNKLNLKENQDVKFPIVIRTGGIGDLISLSSISMNLIDKLKIDSKSLIFISQEKYKDVFNWYKNDITFRSYFSPIVKYNSNNSIEKNRVNKKYFTVYYEGIIENSKQNWFKLQFDTINNDFDVKYGRPQLKTERISNDESNIDISKKSVLINPRSTAIIRSMRFQDLYESLIDCIGYKDINIYVHKINLREEDLNYIYNINDNRINIITAENLHLFLLDAFDVDLVISVDSAIHHFREGVEKPSIGVYGPFLLEARVMYYKYTKSINIASNCPNMPCFIHVRTHDSICDYQKKLHDENIYDNKWYEYAPCCCMEYNKTVKKQIVDKFYNYINTILK